MSPYFWRVQPYGWLALAALGFWIRSAAFGNVTLALALTCTLDTLGFIGTSAAAVLHARHGGATRGAPMLLAPAAACVAGAVLLGLLGSAIRDLLPLGDSAILPAGTFSLGFVYYLGVLCIWSLAYYAFSAEMAVRGERLAEARARQKDLEHLQRQVEPHFVLSALQAIEANIEIQPAHAQVQTRQLANYLAYALDKSSHALSSVEEEVAAARDYVALNAPRLGADFTCHFEIDPAALSMRLPHMTLPALVEHAVRQRQRAGEGLFTVRVLVWARDAMLEIEVDHPGHLSGPFDPARTLPVLDTLSQRLAQRYPGRHALTMEREGGHIVARLSVQGEPSFV
ncbi:sensor histidine kinase [Bordetella genomosp. 13]|uniref:sensor histidine kinase n=1 Tax=Bordetella genomosp. 13 TaxID=463040 RepID=UPI00119FDFCF|nr:histidine kinase [Bordetella genomosp. 13]